MTASRHSSTAAKVTVYADAPPLAPYGYCATDLTSIRIFSLCAYPLGLLPVESDQKSQCFRFHHSPELRWPNQTPILGVDFLRAITRITQTPGLRFRTIFSDVEGYKEVVSGRSAHFSGVETDAESITFHLKYPNRFFPELMCFSSISPIHECRDDLFPGPYRIQTRTTEKISLASQTENRLQQIDFDLRCLPEDPFGIDRYERGELDITCDTFFPHQRIAEFRDRPDFSFTQTRIFVSLSTQGCKVQIPELAIQNLARAIDRLALCESLNGAAIPWTGFGETEPSWHPCLFDPITIPIAFENYAPNLEILQLLDQQLARCGIRIEPVETRYGERLSECALRLELFTKPVRNPLLFYRSMGARPQLHKDPYISRRYLELLTHYQVSGDEIKLGQMDEILIDQGLFIPLLTLKGMELRRESCAAFSWY